LATRQPVRDREDRHVLVVGSFEYMRVGFVDSEVRRLTYCLAYPLPRYHRVEYAVHRVLYMWAEHGSV
jgi:hypothetical protein